MIPMAIDCPVIGSHKPSVQHARRRLVSQADGETFLACRVAAGADDDCGFSSRAAAQTLAECSHGQICAGRIPSRGKGTTRLLTPWFCRDSR